MERKVDVEPPSYTAIGAQPVMSPYPHVNQQPMVLVPMNSIHPQNEFGSRAGQWLLARPISTENRLILDFYNEDWCSTPCILGEEVRTQVPPALQARGITESQWTFWTDRLVKEMKSVSTSITCTIFLCLSVIGIPFNYYYGISQHVKLKKFSQDINDQLFEPLGMYFKTQSTNVSIDDYHEQAAWIAISLNPEESSKLKREEHVFYSFPCAPQGERCTCCTQTCSVLCCCCVELQF